MNMDANITWLLVADGSKAKVYAMHKAKLFNDPHEHNLKLVNEYEHADTRKKNSELKSDRMGEFGGGNFAETTSPKVHEAEQFAHELLHHLDCARKENTFRDLIIIAPPTFMGMLHKHMPHETEKLVCKKIEKDYTAQTAKELVQSLLTHL